MALSHRRSRFLHILKHLVDSLVAVDDSVVSEVAVAAIDEDVKGDFADVVVLPEGIANAQVWYPPAVTDLTPTLSRLAGTVARGYRRLHLVQ
jgi:hypothetical protein